MAINTYNVIWDNGDNTRFISPKLLTALEIKTVFESLSKNKIARVDKIDELDSWEVQELEKTNLSFSYSFIEEGLPFYRNRNHIPNLNCVYNSDIFLERMNTLRRNLWGTEGKIPNATPTK